MNVLINYLGKSNVGPIIAYEMANGLLENGYTVYVLLSDKVQNRAEWERNSNIQKVFIHTYDDKKDFVFQTVKFLLFGQFRIKRHFQGVEFDFIINPMHHMWSSFVLNHFGKSQVITLCHDPKPHEGEMKIESKLTERLMRKSEEIVVLSKQFIEIAGDRFKRERNHIHYMPLGRLNYYSRIQTRFNDSKERKVNYLFFGRIEPYKGVEVLVDAFKKIEKEYSDIRLIIAGKGDTSALEAMIGDDNRIELRNQYIDDGEVGYYFQNTESIRNIVVLPYLTATQSGVIPIAFEYGNLVIASRTGGLYEQLEDGKIGLFVEPGNVVDLSEKMEYAYNHPRLDREQMETIKNNEQHHEWKEIMNNLMSEIKG